MNVLLIRPKMINTGLEFVSSQVPLNLCSLAAAVRDEVDEIRILDLEVERHTSGDYQRRLVDFEPDIIGITVMTPTVPRAGRLAILSKEILPDALVVAGGPHVSALPELTLEQYPAIDLCVCGEGETAFKKIVKKHHSRDFSDIPGVVFKDNSGAIHGNERCLTNEDIDSLPFAARDLLHFNKYRGQSYRGFSRDFLNIAEVATSRGCAGKCLFCAINVTHGRKVRFRSAESVAAELEGLRKTYGINHVVFIDDTFTLNSKRLYKIMSSLRELNITWNCTTRVDAVSDELLGDMVDFGCKGIAFGVESGSSRILDLIEKGVTTEQVKAAFRAAHKAGVEHIEADFMLGSHPSERLEDIEETRKLINLLHPTILFLSVAVPYPGTPLWKIMKEENLIKTNASWEDFLMYGGGDSWKTWYFTVGELRFLQRKILREFYLSAGHIKQILGRISSFRQLLYYLRSGFSLLQGRLR